MARWTLRTLLLAALAPACGPAPVDPATPADDEDLPRRAANAAIAALANRNFDVRDCAASRARLVEEPGARFGTPPGDRCGILVARRSDRTWLVVVRSALPSSSAGARAIVTVLPEAQGVSAIEYAPP
ncbi:hypothetical protein WMF31_40335 [Sorangium sp. So ce1036]|uniref:hypothetical protein n=1 Tax=Sorangium sp. So ce1036 TaxID=3133328 RepID=UPI003F12332D